MKITRVRQLLFSLAISALLPAISFVAIAEATHAPYQGFGSTTPGGEGQSVYRVTNLNDSGPGSLRDAVSKGNRYVVFDVAGEINVQELYIDVKGAFITIDGFTAHSPGITLKNGGLRISGKHGGEHDVILQGLRIRDAALDGIQIGHGAYNVVVDHVSVQGSGDENIDISLDAHDATISWSIFAEGAVVGKNVLITDNAFRLTLHHNLLVKSRQRNPKVKANDELIPPPDVSVDMRNNVIWNWEGGYGTLITQGARANVVNNFYWSSSLERALDVEADENARAYVSGNSPPELDALGTEGAPFPAPPVDTTDACTAAHQILADAGVEPLDTIDQFYLSAISLSGCDGSAEPPPGSSPPPSNSPDLKVRSLSRPKKVEAGNTLSIEDTTKNKGDDPAGASVTKFYLSTDKVFDAGDTYLGGRAIPPLAAGEKNSGTTLVTIPAVAKGKYYIIAVADADGQVSESDEDNNWTSESIKVKVP